MYKMTCDDYAELLGHYLERAKHTADLLRMGRAIPYDWVVDVKDIMESITDAESKLKILKAKWWPEEHDLPTCFGCPHNTLDPEDECSLAVCELTGNCVGGFMTPGETDVPHWCPIRGKENSEGVDKND